MEARRVGALAQPVEQFVKFFSNLLDMGFML
jgi:hypothetical protein